MIAVLITAIGAVVVASVAGTFTLVNSLVQRPSKTVGYESRLERRDQKIAELQDDNEKYYAVLKECEDEVRRLKQKLYEEQVGHNICERKLSEALRMLGERDERPPD